MKYLLIVLIVFLALFLIFKLKGNRSKNGSEDTIKSPDEVYVQWISEWRKNSRAAKFENSYQLISILGSALIIIYLFFDYKLGILFNLAENNIEEILQVLASLPTFLLIIFVFFTLDGLIFDLLKIRSFVDMAEWLSKNDVYSYPALGNGLGSQVFYMFVGNSILIKERPSTKKIFYIRIGVKAILGALTAASLYSFTNVLFSYVIINREFSKEVFLSPSAFFFYITTIVVWVFNNKFGKFLRNKQEDLINSLSQKADE